jgi:hypothetical protein
MWYFIAVVVSLGVGFVGGFLVFKNNPKYLDIAKMGKEQLEILKKQIEDILHK